MASPTKLNRIVPTIIGMGDHHQYDIEVWVNGKKSSDNVYWTFVNTVKGFGQRLTSKDDHSIVTVYGRFALKWNAEYLAKLAEEDRVEKIITDALNKTTMALDVRFQQPIVELWESVVRNPAGRVVNLDINVDTSGFRAACERVLLNTIAAVLKIGLPDNLSAAEVSALLHFQVKEWVGRNRWSIKSLHQADLSKVSSPVVQKQITEAVEKLRKDALMAKFTQLERTVLNTRGVHAETLRNGRWFWHLGLLVTTPHEANAPMGYSTKEAALRAAYAYLDGKKCYPGHEKDREEMLAEGWMVVPVNKHFVAKPPAQDAWELLGYRFVRPDGFAGGTFDTQSSAWSVAVGIRSRGYYKKDAIKRAGYAIYDCPIADCGWHFFREIGNLRSKAFDTEQAAIDGCYERIVREHKAATEAKADLRANASSVLVAGVDEATKETLNAVPANTINAAWIAVGTIPNEKLATWTAEDQDMVKDMLSGGVGHETHGYALCADGHMGYIIGKFVGEKSKAKVFCDVYREKGEFRILLVKTMPDGSKETLDRRYNLVALGDFKHVRAATSELDNLRRERSELLDRNAALASQKTVAVAETGRLLEEACKLKDEIIGLRKQSQFTTECNDRQVGIITKLERERDEARRTLRSIQQQLNAGIGVNR